MERYRNPGVASTTGRVERSVVLPTGRDAAWTAITRAEDLSSWFGADADVDLRRGGRATFRWPDGAERGAIVEDVDPGQRLSFRWLPFVRVGGRPEPAPAGRVELVLTEEDGGRATRLTVSEWTAGVAGLLPPPGMPVGTSSRSGG